MASLRDRCRAAAREVTWTGCDCNPAADAAMRVAVEACAAHVEQAQVSAGPCGQLELAARIRALLDDGGTDAKA